MNDLKNLSEIRNLLAAHPFLLTTTLMVSALTRIQNISGSTQST